MIVYLSGLSNVLKTKISTDTYLIDLIRERSDNRKFYMLGSFAHFNPWCENPPDDWQSLINRETSEVGAMFKVKDALTFFLDSGAHSVRTKGIVISIHSYGDFLSVYADNFPCYANMDVIGDWKTSMENQRILEDYGLMPLPVYHIGEPDQYLIDLVSEYSYVGIGGVASSYISQRELIRCLDTVFFAEGKRRFGQTKFHAFGITSPRLLKRYPWYSADSTAWIKWAAYGRILTLEGEPICISSGDSAKKELDRNFDGKSEQYKFRIQQFVDGELEKFNLDFTFEDIRREGKLRAIFNFFVLHDVYGSIEWHEPEMVNDRLF